MENIVLQHGVPEFLMTDHGKNLTTKASEKLFDALATDHHLSMINHKKSNGSVERWDHLCTDMLVIFINNKQDNWSDLLSSVTFAYNTSRQESTGFTPFYLLFARKPRLPIYLEYKTNADETTKTGDQHEHADEIISLLKQAREIVARRSLIVQAEYKKRYDHHHVDKTFDVGQQILIYKPIRKKRI